MKRTKALTLTSLFSLSALFGSSAQAQIVNVNLYQNRFEIPKTISGASVYSAKVADVVSQYSVDANPAYDSFESESPYIYTTLQKTKVVKIQLMLSTSFASESEEATEITAYLPLTMFSEADLTILQSRRAYQRIKTLKKYVEFKRVFVPTTTTELVCLDPTYDTYNNRIEDCPRLSRETHQGSQHTLVIRKK